MKDITTQALGFSKTNNTNAEIKRMSTPGYNKIKTKIKLAPIETSPVALPIEIISTTNNLEIESQDNP
ncbi:26562_t:CDS:1, partial [Dentiscutata erythropus]